MDLRRDIWKERKTLYENEVKNPIVCLWFPSHFLSLGKSLNKSKIETQLERRNQPGPFAHVALMTWARARRILILLAVLVLVFAIVNFIRR